MLASMRFFPSSKDNERVEGGEGVLCASVNESEKGSARLLDANLQVDSIIVAVFTHPVL